MHIIKQYERMRDCLSNLVECELAKDPKCINAEELGEVVDMIKDYEEAIYYHCMSHVLKEDVKEEEMRKKIYCQRMNQDFMYFPFSRMGKMYFPKDKNGKRYNEEWSMPTSDGSMAESATNYPNYEQKRDSREGKSSLSRCSYIESKETHQDKTKQMTELNRYLQELADDITEMIEDATPEEKIIVSQKLNTLASKVK